MDNHLGNLPPWAQMWLLAMAIFVGCKLLTLLDALRKGHSASFWRIFCYTFLWCGMDIRPFLLQHPVSEKPKPQEWFYASLNLAIGLSLYFGLARIVPESDDLIRGWLGGIGIILILHCGVLYFLALVWQHAGTPVQPLMNSPVKSRSLSEFWGRRWNRGFHNLSYDYVYGPLCPLVGQVWALMITFLASGLIHDGVISIPARGGYGLPTLYFILQGIGVLIERSIWGKKMGLGSGVRGWLWMACFTLLPVYGLFHPPFIREVLLPFMRATGALQGEVMDTRELFSVALWLAGIGQFIVLIASVQVPKYFKWKEDFAKLSPFNRKLVWTYACYIFATIFSFGVLTLALHDEFLNGDKAAMGLAIFMGLFWTTRIGLDALSFGHCPWPKGAKFVLGHILLTTLFACLAGTYIGVVAWHIGGKP